MNPVYSNDPYLGRIPARFVTPPHMSTNLRRCLSSAENIDDRITTWLFISCSSKGPIDATQRLSILSYPGPGCSPNDPMALVAVFSNSSVRVDELVEPVLSGDNITPFDPQYSKHGSVKCQSHLH